MKSAQKIAAICSLPYHALSSRVNKLSPQNKFYGCTGCLLFVFASSRSYIWRFELIKNQMIPRKKRVYAWIHMVFRLYSHHPSSLIILDNIVGFPHYPHFLGGSSMVETNCLAPDQWMGSIGRVVFWLFRIRSCYSV